MDKLHQRTKRNTIPNRPKWKSRKHRLLGKSANNLWVKCQQYKTSTPIVLLTSRNFHFYTSPFDLFKIQFFNGDQKKITS